MPEWAKKEIESNGTMEYIAKFLMISKSSTKQLTRLSPGMLIREIFEHFAQKINKTLSPDRNAWFYSVHDYIISNLLNGLGVLKVVFVIFKSIYSFMRIIDVFFL